MIDADTFRSVLGRFASGVTIVSARDRDGQDHGMTVSAFCSASLEPPLVLFCVDRTASMFGLLREHPWVGISILSADQEAYSRRFSAPESDRFDAIAYTRGESEVILLSEALAHLECQIVGHVDVGDHMALTARVERASPSQGRPLLYYRGGYAQLER
jgi:flavin reductase (DIM6/NTAB) family NADH-FMN oxidoreductase RutF